MKKEVAVTLIMIVSIIITVVMVVAEMDTFGYLFSGRLSAIPFLPLIFGIIMSIVVVALKKENNT